MIEVRKKREDFLGCTNKMTMKQHYTLGAGS